MKTLSFFSCLLIIFCWACTPDSQPVTVVLDSNPSQSFNQKLLKIKSRYANIDTSKILIDTRKYKIDNEGLNKMSIDSIGEAIHTNNLAHNSLSAIQTPFIIPNNPQSEPLKSIISHFDKIDGFYIGFGKTSNNRLGIETIYLTFITIAITESNGITTEKVSNFLEDNKKIIFKYIGNGSWVRILDTEMNQLKSNLALPSNKIKGYIFGKNLFYFPNTTPENKYIYVGFNHQNLQLIVTNEELKEIKKIDEFGRVSFVINSKPSLTNCTFGTHVMQPIYSKDKFVVKFNQLFRLNAACIRPCPAYCTD